MVLMKIFRLIKTGETEELQRHLTRLGGWGIQWQIKFSVDKCKVRSSRMNNLSYLYPFLGSK